MSWFSGMSSSFCLAQAVRFADQVSGFLRAGGRAARMALIVILLTAVAACGTSKTAPVGAGQYRVVKGDTLTLIARRHGQSVESLMSLNRIINPNQIKVGQVLTVRGGSPMPAPMAGGGIVAPPAAVSGKSIAAPRSINLVWPAQGSSRRGTTASTTQGVYISAAEKTPVKAAAAGKVVYAGSGLRGYGNMLIINHDANFLSVYAHNASLLVNEGANVKQGQQIATMGNTGSNAVNLYFELRYNGKPVDALRYLPK